MMRHRWIPIVMICGLWAMGLGWARAETSPLPSSPAAKANAQVEGFRSARFGMSVEEVARAIERDFKISKSSIHREIHPSEKTTQLWVNVPEVLSGAGPARIFYIFGFKSKRLITINVFWGRPAVEKPDAEAVVSAANQLRNYFIQQGFQREGMIVNTPLGEGLILVFRAQDARGRMVVLVLSNPPAAEGKPENANISLRLSYILNPESPDVFHIKPGEF